jgi:hypothetical protein
MAVTRPGQVEFGGLLFDTAPGESGVWIPRGATRSGWHPRRKRAIRETEAGGAAGKSLWEPMYPAIEGVACDTAAALDAVFDALDPDAAPSPLEWWSFERDTVFTVNAVAELPEPVENDDSEHQATRFVDVMWVVQRPGDIEESS